MRRFCGPLAAIALAVSSAGLTACGDSSPGSGEITVFAASSLTDAFEEAGASFEKANPGTKVTFSFAASSALAVQINEGAPADVFASADEIQMQSVVGRGNAEAPRVFATNTPVVVVPAGGAKVAAFSDLAKPGLTLVLASPNVPIGRYANEILANASAMPSGIGADFAATVRSNVRSEEANVRAVLTKVQLGEADAGIVYATDVPAGGDAVRTVEIPTAYNVVAEYPVAVLRESRDAVTAAAFVSFLLGPDGQAILARHGFAGP